MEEIRKIFIPSRGYNLNVEREPECRIRDYEGEDKVEDKYFETQVDSHNVLKMGNIDENLDLGHDTYSLMKMPHESDLITLNPQLLKNKFESIRNEIKKKYDSKINELNKATRKKIYILRAELETKLKSMVELELFMQNQLSIFKPPTIEKIYQYPELNIANAPSLIENIPIINSTFENYEPPKYIVNCSNSLIYFTKDFKTVKKSNMPAQFKGKYKFYLLIKNQTEVLIVYENGFVFVVDILENKSTRISDFSVIRRNFSVTYIDSYPSIIGGYMDNTIYPIVEILVNGSWQLTEPLNVPRRDCVSIKHETYTYALGGSNQTGENIASAEKYVNGVWILLNISLPSIARSAACCKGNYFYIFKDKKTPVITYDRFTDNCSLEKNLQSNKALKVKFNSSIISIQNYFMLITTVGNLIHYFPN